MLANADDLQDYLDRDVSVAQADLVLELASALVESSLGRRIERVTGETLTSTVSGRLLFLPSPPVDVTSVTIDGVDIVADVVVNAGEGTVVVPVGYDGRTATVVYDAGFETVPDVARAVTLSLAARLLTNPDGITQKSIGDVSVSYGRAQSGPGLTEWEQNALGPLRLLSVS